MKAWVLPLASYRAEVSQKMVKGRAALVYFLMAAVSGCWIPVLAIVLEERGWESLTDWVFVISASGAIFSPLFVGALADQRIHAQRLLAGILAGTALFTVASFWFLGAGDSQVWFLIFFTGKALLAAPSWSLVASITLTHLEEPERHFGGVRVWGTLGWMAACWSVSLCALDRSPAVGFLSAGIGFAAALVSLSLPATPPLGSAGKTWTEKLGLNAFGILRDRDTAVYFLTAFLFSIPLAAYYPYSAKFLNDLGVENVATVLSIGQVSEIGAMLLMGWVFRSLRVKWIFLLALSAGFLRYAIYAVTARGSLTGDGPLLWMLAGILMHGICWTFFFESGRLFLDRRVDQAMRSQAQALVSVLVSGVATILGVLFVGVLYRWCASPEGLQWSLYWLVLAGLCLVATVVYAVGYQGQGKNSGG